MTSSSSCLSNITIKSGPIHGDVLWMQAKHVWNGEEDWKLHIKRVVPTYQGDLPYLFFYTERCAVSPIIKLNQSEVCAS